MTLNHALQNLCLSTSKILPYAIDSDGNNLYLIELVYNITNYSVQFNSYPTIMKTGYTNPKNAIFNSYCAQINITSNLCDIIGLTKNENSPTITNNNSLYSVYSSLYNLTPNFNPINSIIMRCNLIKNDICITEDILFQF